MPEQPVKKDFFVSYNRADRPWAEWIAWQLENEGYSTVVQAWDFRPGGNFVLDMQEAAQAERTIAVLSPDYLTSLYTQPEWAAAFAQDPTGAESKLLPVRVRECEPQGLLRPVVYIDLVGLQKLAARNALLEGVKRGRVKPESEPHFPNDPARSVSEEPRFPGALPSVWNVPHLRNPNFTGREELLDALEGALNSGQPAALTQTIHGLGGVGKTQLATEYAYRNCHRYDKVWWMRSEEPAALAADYAALAEKLGLPEAQLPEQRRAVEAVRTWLGHNADWLLIFDNVRTRDEVKDYLPQSATGHVIITSRDPNWRGVAQPLQVPVLPRDKSVEFLLQRTSQTDAAAADAVAEALRDLPLALEQAGAYIDETQQPLADYARLFGEHHQRLLERGTPSTNYQATVATTWDISFQEVAKQSPAAQDLMNLCAFLAPDDIPLDIIRDAAEHLPESLAAAVKDPLAFNDIIAALRRYSLIERSGDTISVHRLVQLVLRDRLTEDAAKTWAEAAVGLVDDAFPSSSGDVRTWPVCSQLLPHSLVVIDHVKALRVAGQHLVRLLNQVGVYLNAHAEFGQARDMCEQAVALAKEAYSEDSSEMAATLSNLGEILRHQKDLAGARANIERALKITEAAHGPGYLWVAIYYNNLGAVLREQGDLAGALACYERALAIYESRHDTDNSQVAALLNNIAMVLSGQGELAGARMHLERALSLDEAMYGKEHPKVATRLNNLASVVEKQGDLQGARAYYERALNIFRKFLGEDHPSTLIVKRNLAP